MSKQFIFCIALSALLANVGCELTQPGTRVLRRVVKSTPTATNLARIKMVTVRSTNNDSAVTEITSKEAANFGQRGQLASSQGTNTLSADVSAIKSRPIEPTSTSSTTTTTPASTSSTSTTPTSTTSSAPSTTSGSVKSLISTASPSTTSTTKNKASERLKASSSAEVEVLSGSPSSWQSMTAVEAPAAMLIAAGPRPALDLSASNSSASEESSSSRSTTGSVGDFLRASTSETYTQSVSDQSFSKYQNQQSTLSKTNQKLHQQSFFYPRQQQLKTSTKTQVATKTTYVQPTTSTTTPRPAHLIEQQPYVEPQLGHYVEQQAEYGAAPLGQAEPFAFDFRTQDQSGNGQYRREESDKNGVVRGSYGYTDANGIYRHVEYIADENGFRANIKSNEPGLQIGETQPASIQYSPGAPSTFSGVTNTNSLNNPRLTAPPVDDINRSGEWSASGHQFETAAVTPTFAANIPAQGERLRSPRQNHF